MKLCRTPDAVYAQGQLGSRIFLKVGLQEPKFDFILEAAMIAAYYSRGRGSSRIAVRGGRDVRSENALFNFCHQVL